mmetsp:Transcript_3714/g.7929  ORF Transcript_3714/g.7929 Transcript_3714/m.7929 type:complete len:82 (-) Transcript_3714:905-1150(-)
MWVRHTFQNFSQKADLRWQINPGSVACTKTENITQLTNTVPQGLFAAWLKIYSRMRCLDYKIQYFSHVSQILSIGGNILSF